MKIAELVSLRGTCPRASVGAVLVKDRRIISMGYNGAPPGQPHCTEVGCTSVPFEVGLESEDAALRRGGCQRTIHAEANSILWAGRAGISTVGTQMYSTYSPCAHCAKMIVAAGVGEFLYKNDYRAANLKLLEDMGVKVMKVV
jgi:dCMP deaminase